MTPPTAASDISRRIHPQQLLLPGVGLGALMILLGLALMTVFQKTPVWYPLTGVNIATELLLGGFLGLLATALVWFLTEKLAAMRRLREKIAEVLDLSAVTVWYALAFGLLAGIPEEILFRGAVQPFLGIFLTALLFGVLHAISPLYVVYAGLAGVGLGLLAEWRGDLWAATAAHAVYDASLFLVMARWAKR